MRRFLIGIFLVSLTTLMTELVLTRVFDTILTPNLAYMVITCAMFSFGISGVYAAIKPLSPDKDVSVYLSVCALVIAVSAIAILPIFNFLPFDHTKVAKQPVIQIVSFGAMYLTLVVPFFFAGLIFATLFSKYSKTIQKLYFWDLIGAAIGCIILVPLLPEIGPGGLLFCASAFALIASALFSNNKTWSITAGTVAIGILIIPFAHSPQYYDFKEHVNKRAVKDAREKGLIEYTSWDPISKIDVINKREIDPITTKPVPGTLKKHIAYDGGQQSSHIYAFNGDFKKLREHWIENVKAHFWNRGVLASHYIKQDSNQRVLIIGSAGGQETKAALMYGAAYIDAVEMVKTVVDIGKKKYADYNGNIFNHPNVRVQAGEGRSFLRATKDKYDIIQIYSNHVSSSMAAGTGAMSPTYLQTAEAYQEYFEHLNPNGILHINHHIFPKMISTAALAWKRMGLHNFRKHVVVFVREKQDNIPTFLIKMSPWEEYEINQLKELFFTSLNDGERSSELVEDPLNPDRSFLSEDFYTGAFPEALARSMRYRVMPSTDNKPYFSFLRKEITELPVNENNFLDRPTAMLLNSQLIKSVPMDIIHLFVTGASSLLFTVLFIFIPLYFSQVGRTGFQQKANALLYFSCLGAGFIIYELVFIQIFMKLIGYPLYTYSTVLFTLLFAAGIGSLSSDKLNIGLNNRWSWPFIGIIAYALILWLSYAAIFNIFLTMPIAMRVLVSIILIFPLGFFLGMPFPLGILALEKQPKGAIAWAWGMNGLFTVIGGLLSVVLSLFFGFKITLLAALCLYIIAFIVFARIRTVLAS